MVSPLGKKIVFFVSSKTGINDSKTLLEACWRLSKIIIQLFNDSSSYLELSIASNNLLLEILNSILDSFWIGIVLQNKSSTVVVFEIEK